MKFRKTAALLLTGAFVIAMGTNAMAMEQTRVPSVNSRSVYGTYVPGEKADTVYSVDIEWGDMDFTYTAGDEGTWNPETHQYEGGSEGTWTAKNNIVTVTNHSELPVEVSFGYAEHPGYENITGSYSVTEDVLESGVGKTYEEADSISSELTLSGALPKGSQKANIGSVNVHLRVVE